MDLSLRGVAIVTNKIKLSSNQKKCLRDFRKKTDFYGALFVAPGTEVCGWHRNVPNLKNARVLAKAECEDQLGAKEVDCVEVAVINRKSKTSGSTTDLPLWGVREIKQAHGKKREFSGQYVALSSSGFVAGGWSINATQALAQDTASLRCKEDVTKLLSRYTKGVRDAIKKNGMDKCRVTHVSKIS